MQKKVTISLDDKILKQYKDFCEKNDIMFSKRIEKLIKEHVEKEALKNLK